MKKLYLTLSSLTLALAAQAIPAWPGLFTRTLPDGSVISYYQRGDEHVMDYESADGLRLFPDAEGILRYAATDARGQIYILPGSPVAKDAQMRTAEDLQFLQGVKPRMAQTPVRVARQSAPLYADAAGFPDMKKGNFPATGERHIPVILVEFSNSWTFTYTKDDINRMLNEEGYKENGFTGSARDYFQSSSNGQFTPVFDVYGPVKLSKSYMNYGKNTMSTRDAGVGNMVNEACIAAHDQLGVDFSQYDSDNNGDVDMVYFIYVKYGENFSGEASQIWPHKGTLKGVWDIDLELDGKKIDTYAMSQELYGKTGTQSAGIGALCHEFSHVLGLVDHYNQTNQSNYTTGTHDIMCSGPYNNQCLTPPAYNAMERMSLGWMTPEVLSQQGDVILEDITSSNRAYAVQTSDPNQFFLLETRLHDGYFNESLPSEGLMITRVSYDEATWLDNSPNTDARSGFALICADGRATDKSEENDFWPNGENNAFTTSSDPAMTLIDGTPVADSGIYSIRRVEGKNAMTFSYKVPSSVREIEAANDGASIWYDLSGRQIAAPTAHGIYLRKNGNKTTKIII